MTAPINVADSRDPSASYAAEVTRLLWPAPWSQPQLTRSIRRPAVGYRDAYVFPNTRNPRLLVPADLRAAATMVQRLGNDDATLIGPLRRLLRASVGSPLFSATRWPRLRVLAVTEGSDSIERHLAGVLGADVRVGVVLGPRRVNQKPVLQVFGLDGALLAFAKVGHNPLTTALVRHEAQSLAAVGELGPRLFRAPEMLDAGTWSGLDVLVMSPLMIEPGCPVDASTRVSAMVELSRLGEVRRRTLADSPFLARLRDHSRRLADCTHGPALADSVAAIVSAHGDVELTFGSWHGDWGPWNMGMKDGSLQLWDWERYDAEVPLGLDGLHFIAQRVHAQHDVEAAQEADFLSAVPAALAPFGVDPALHDVTVRLYLLEMAVRYVDALRHGARPDFAQRTAWVVSLLSRLLQQPTTHTSEGRP